MIHLERVDSYEKAYFYTDKYAKVQALLGNPLKAIAYYKRTLNYPNVLSKSDVAISIAKLYEKNSQYEKSYKYFEIANQIAIQNNEFDIEIYTLLEMIIIKINDITDMNIGIDYTLGCVRRLLDEEFYPKGEIYYYYALSLKYRLEYNHKETLLNAMKALNICKENKISEDIYGWIILVLVEVYAKEGEYEESRRRCLYATEVFVSNNNINGELYSKLFYAYICKEEGKTNEIILHQYLEITKLSNKCKVYTKEILSLIYIASIYNQEKKYAKVEEYLLKALEREREEAIDEYSFDIFNEFCLLYIKLGKINLAIKYHYLIKQMGKGLKLSEEQVINSNYAYALYNLLICNYDMAYDYFKKIYELISNTRNFHYKTIVCNYYQLMLYKCENIDDINNIYGKLSDEVEDLQNEEVALEVRINARFIQKKY